MESRADTMSKTSSNGLSGGWTSQKIDLDSHEFIPMEKWATAFGDVGEQYNRLQMRTLIELGGENAMSRPDIKADDKEVSAETIWKLKGPSAPSSIDLSRRPEVLDVMGIDRQLVFPTFALVALLMAYEDNADKFLQFDRAGLDTRQLGRDGCDAHNRWAAAITRQTNQRVRPVAIVRPDDVPGMIEQTERLVDEGCRAILMPAGAPPAGTSPADRALDPFWAILNRHKIPLTFHLGTEMAFLASMAWSANVPEFNPTTQSVEFQVEPYRTATFHFCMENYITTMALGGVFERHPDLKVGVLETAAHWVGPLAERLDITAGQFKKRLAKTLTMEPSKYLTRALRVAPFPFEPVDRYLHDYPELSEIYCFMSDYPHAEGGIESEQTFSSKLKGFDEGIRRGFFRDNGIALTPD